MKLYIKQKVFTLGEEFEVRDANNNTVFYCKGSFFKIPKSFQILDKNHNHVGTVEKEFMTLLPRYTISDLNRTITLRKNFTFIFASYTIDNIAWELSGNFTGHNYQLLHGDIIIMSLTKHWFTWGDSYELDIKDDNDMVLALGISLAIDHVLAAADSAAASSQ